METLWFCLTAFLLTGYVVLDGFDLGAGAVHLIVARTNEERQTVLASIGPVWDGNEVWLITGGVTLFFAFPTLYAASFSGFYLPLMIVLWLLILRGLAIELRGHVATAVWRPFWDVVFTGASLLLAIFFGAALGNVVRGVPLSAQGQFFLPLWTHLGVSGEVGILDWYTVLVALLALLALVQHGALWVVYKTSGAVRERADRIARFAWSPVVVLTVLVTLATFSIQPQVPASLTSRPWTFIFPALAVSGLAATWWQLRKGRELAAFLASCAYIAGMLASVAAGIYPYVLPSNVDSSAGLTIYNSAAGDYGLRLGLYWWLPGMLLALGYTVVVYRKFMGKVS